MLHIGFTFHYDETAGYIDRTMGSTQPLDKENEDFLHTLKFFTHNAHSLQNISRMCIRTSLSFSKSLIHIDKKIESLDIPVSLKNYLKLQDIFE